MPTRMASNSSVPWQARRRTASSSRMRPEATMASSCSMMRCWFTDNAFLCRRVTADEVGRVTLRAAVRAEVDPFAGLLERGGGVRSLHLHAAHRVARVSVPGAEPVAVLVDPVQESEHAQEEEIEVRGVVPREVGGRHSDGSCGRDQPGRTEDQL